MSAIEIVAATGLVIVQDAGRPGLQHQGVPPGGALVPELLESANTAASNTWGEAALEVFGAVTIVARIAGVAHVTRGELVVASDGGERRALRDGETWSIACAGARVRYLAVRGGLAVPRVLGGRGTLLAAGLGGHEGRALRRRDVLPIGDAPECLARAPAAPDLAAAVRVVLGPDQCRFPPAAIDALLGSELVVDPRSDRTGIRLAGTALPRHDADDKAPSAPMVRGAIQVPPSGLPIVLGPDHPTTGGYPVIAVVARGDMGALAARPIGASVRFVAYR